MAKYPKYVLLHNDRTDELFLKFGCVEFHKDLISESDKDDGWRCMGGGLFKPDFDRREIVLYGRSTDFGKPDSRLLKKAIETFEDYSTISVLLYMMFESKYPNTGNIMDPIWDDNFKLVEEI